MTDNRTTELREKLDELGIEHFDYDKGGRTQTMWESPGDMRHFTYETAANPAKTAKLIIEWFPTPEQAIAATLGSVPDEIELTQSYDAGCRNGVMAVFQQLEGIEDYEELQCFIAEYWAEGEGNDER